MGSLSDELNEKARRIRLGIVKMTGTKTHGHIGGSCSIADITAALYFHVMRFDLNRHDRDRLIFSKGHAALAQYSALWLLGIIPFEELLNVKNLGAMLQGHPDMRRTPGIEANTGSLGQGLSIACGMAAGAKLAGYDSRMYCIVGDGETNEGQIWEAAMSASHFGLDNVIVVVDRNRLQASGTTKEIMDSAGLDKKWEAFGWNVQVIDGHDMDMILDAFTKAKAQKGKPSVIIADTIKGKGVPFAENVVSYHNCLLCDQEYDDALCALEKEG